MILLTLKPRRWLWLVALLAIPAMLPLAAVPFFRSDDGLLHLFRVPGLDTALKQGEFFPRLFPSFAFGYGQAILSYYSPLTYYVAVALHNVGATIPDALKWTFALGYVGSAVTAYMFLKQFVPAESAALGASVYVYFPYHLAETYWRGALAEHFAWVWLPLILWGATPALDQARLRSCVFVLGLTALILTHNLTALMFAPCALSYHWLMATERRWMRRTVTLLREALLTLGLSAFYWLPLANQTRWVQVSGNLVGEFTPHVAPLTQFVQSSLWFEYPSHTPQVDHALGLFSFALWLVGLVGWWFCWRQKNPLTRFMSWTQLLTLSALLMVVEWSEVLWQVFRNPLGFLQFPWRFLTLVGLGLACSTALALRQQRLFAWALIPVVMATALAQLPVRAEPLRGTDDLAMWKHEFTVGEIGTTLDAEYMPWWVHAERATVPNAAPTPLSPVTVQATPRLAWLTATYTERRYRVSPVSNATNTLIRFHQFYLPQWHAQLNGQTLPTFPSTLLGLLTIEVPPEAEGELRLRFTLTTLEQIGLWLTGATGLVVAYLWRGRWMAGVAGVAWVGGIAFVLVTSRTTTMIVPMQAQLEDSVALVGAQLSSPTAQAGDALRVTLAWQVLRETREPINVFVHLVEPNGNQLVAQADGVPVGGYTPVSHWHVGELIEDTRTLMIPSHLAPTTLQLVTGMYRLNPVRNLAARTLPNGRPLPDGRIPLGTVQVYGR